MHYYSSFIDYLIIDFPFIQLQKYRTIWVWSWAPHSWFGHRWSKMNQTCLLIVKVVFGIQWSSMIHLSNDYSPWCNFCLLEHTSVWLLTHNQMMNSVKTTLMYWYLRYVRKQQIKHLHCLLHSSNTQELPEQETRNPVWPTSCWSPYNNQKLLLLLPLT